MQSADDTDKAWKKAWCEWKAHSAEIGCQAGVSFELERQRPLRAQLLLCESQNSCPGDHARSPAAWLSSAPLSFSAPTTFFILFSICDYLTISHTIHHQARHLPLTTTSVHPLFKLASPCPNWTSLFIASTLFLLRIRSVPLRPDTPGCSADRLTPSRLAGTVPGYRARRGFFPAVPPSPSWATLTLALRFEAHGPRLQDLFKVWQYPPSHKPRFPQAFVSSIFPRYSFSPPLS